MPVKVKICSITNLDDAMAAISAGADAIGFIGVADTPRYVSPETYREIARQLPLDFPAVVVVRNAADGLEYGAHWIQYYGGEIDGLPGGIGLIKVIRPKSIDELHDNIALLPERVSAILLDAYHPEKLGGASATADWSIAAEAVRISPRPVYLAGGLTPENVAEAVSAVKPYGVDVSSGVELRPRVKDHERVRAFVAAAKAASTF